MYKDFKQSESLDTGFVGGSGIIWMFSGIVLGLLVGMGMYYFSNDKSSRIRIVDSLQKKIESTQSADKSAPSLSNFSQRTTPATSTVANRNETVKAKSSNESKFSYYAVLPTLDVPVNSSRPIDTRKQAVESLPNQQQTQEVAQIDAVTEEVQLEEVEPANIGDYLLQVASFKKQSMADKTRGRLSNKGIDAYVQKKKIKGRFWYRVVAGPVDQMSIDNWKLTAEKLGHKPLVISVR